MRLFKRQRSCPKPEPPSSRDESQKSWALFRFFSGGSNEPAAETVAAAAASDSLPDEKGQRQPRATAADSLCNASTMKYTFCNQKYTPEVALSPESQPLSPKSQSLESLPLRQAQNSDSHNSGDMAKANGAKSKALESYQPWQQRKPRFQIRPCQDDDDEKGGNRGRRISVASSSVSTLASENLVSLSTKFAFVYQDGKFVEREVSQWPKPQRSLPHLRYRNLEPYATSYGRRYRDRLANQERIVTQRERCIYHNPIFRLPRKVMEENKMRLMTRHYFKDCFEGSKTIIGPQKIIVNEQEQSTIMRQIINKHNYKDTKKLVHHLACKSRAVRAN